MKYDKSFTKEVTELAKDFLSDTKDKKFKNFSIEVDGSFSEVPVIEICRCMDAGMPFEAQEKIARYCILGKPIKIYLEDELLETILMNKLDDRWDIFKVFTQYPLALQTLIDVCVAHVSKKFVPPSKSTQTTEETKESNS